MLQWFLKMTAYGDKFAGRTGPDRLARGASRRSSATGFGRSEGCEFDIAGGRRICPPPPAPPRLRRRGERNQKRLPNHHPLLALPLSCGAGGGARGWGQIPTIRVFTTRGRYRPSAWRSSCCRRSMRWSMRSPPTSSARRSTPIVSVLPASPSRTAPTISGKRTGVFTGRTRNQPDERQSRADLDRGTTCWRDTAPAQSCGRSSATTTATSTFARRYDLPTPIVIVARRGRDRTSGRRRGRLDDGNSCPRKVFPSSIAVTLPDCRARSPRAGSPNGCRARASARARSTIACATGSSSRQRYWGHADPRSSIVRSAVRFAVPAGRICPVLLPDVEYYKPGSGRPLAAGLDPGVRPTSTAPSAAVPPRRETDTMAGSVDFVLVLPALRVTRMTPRQPGIAPPPTTGCRWTGIWADASTRSVTCSTRALLY